MQIDKLQSSVGADIYYDGNFRNVLDDHMTYFRGSSSTKTITIEPIYADKYEGDLSGLLSQYGIAVEYHWVIMRLNNFTSFNDNSRNLSQLLIPNFDEVEQIRQVHRTVQNKIKT